MCYRLSSETIGLMMRRRSIKLFPTHTHFLREENMFMVFKGATADLRSKIRSI